jgi:CDP-4-dehydro-6-deoxyglucose reductase
MALKEKHLVEVSMIQSHCESTKSFYFRFVESHPMQYKAGQFVIAHVPKGDTIVKRAYSIASSPQETEKTGLLEICLNRVEAGYVSNWMHERPEQTRIYMDGPHGLFTVPDNLSKGLLFCATGTGIAPIRSILHDLESKHQLGNQEIWVFFGVRLETDILYQDEFSHFSEKYPNFHFIVSVSRPVQWTGETRYVQDVLKDNIQNPEEWEVYACGLSTMIKELGATLESMGFKKEQLHYDKWG